MMSRYTLCTSQAHTVDSDSNRYVFSEAYTFPCSTEASVTCCFGDTTDSALFRGSVASTHFPLLHISCCFLQRVGVVQHFWLLVAMIFLFDLRSCPLHTSSCPHHWCLLQHIVTVSVWCSIMILFARNQRVRLEVFERISTINLEVQDESLSVQRSTALGFL